MEMKFEKIRNNFPQCVQFPATSPFLDPNILLGIADSITGVHSAGGRKGHTRFRSSANEDYPHRVGNVQFTQEEATIKSEVTHRCITYSNFER
jgi:hypothetical protein